MVTLVASLTMDRKPAIKPPFPPRMARNAFERKLLVEVRRLQPAQAALVLRMIRAINEHKGQPS